MNIKYISYKEINFKKWDACILSSSCSLPYALSFYLDATCDKNWDALVLEDYTAVMPLPIREKLGVSYVFQPYFSQQLGIYSTINLTQEQEESFIKIIPSSIKYIDTYINYTNTIAGKSRCNLILDLQQSYENIYNGFSDNLKRNLKKATKYPLVFEAIQESEYLSFAKKIMLDEEKNKYSKEIYDLLVQLYKVLDTNKMLQAYAIKEGNSILSVALFIVYKNRIVNLAPFNSPTAKEKQTSAFLFDAIIKQYADTSLFLDFEGSEIAGVKNFYKQFGAIEQNYSHYKENRLPRLLRFLKK
jgi:hypothetical protein